MHQKNEIKKTSYYGFINNCQIYKGISQNY